MTRHSYSGVSHYLRESMIPEFGSIPIDTHRTIRQTQGGDQDTTTR